MARAPTCLPTSMKRPADRNGGGGRRELVALPEYFRPSWGCGPRTRSRCARRPATDRSRRFSPRLRPGSGSGWWDAPCRWKRRSKARSTIPARSTTTPANVARYDKIHLVQPGSGQEKFAEQAPSNRASWSRWWTRRRAHRPFVCYDLRFPELYRAMKDVDIIVVRLRSPRPPAAPHWKHWSGARHRKPVHVLAPAQVAPPEAGARPRRFDDRGPVGNVLDRLPRGSGIVSALGQSAYQASLRKSLRHSRTGRLHRI